MIRKNLIMCCLCFVFIRLIMLLIDVIFVLFVGLIINKKAHLKYIFVNCILIFEPFAN